MRIEVNPLKQKLEVVVEHNGKHIPFLANVFTRKALTDAGFDVFAEINEYWAGLPAQKQEKIFQIYAEADEAFELHGDSDMVFNILNKCVCDLVKLHPLDALEFWLSVNPSIVVPESVKEFPPDPTENTFPVEKTYTRRDYFPLLGLSMFLRTVLPIWGQYIESVRKASEKNREEFIAMQLLNNSGLLDCVAMNRLRVYINAAITSDSLDHGKVLDNFSSEDMGFLFLAQVCVKRLCLGDLRGTDSKTQLVATIFKYMAQKTFNQPDSGVTIKREKIREDSSGADTGKNSIFETYRKRAELSLGELAEMQFVLSDLVGIGQRLEPSLTEEEVYRSVTTAQRLSSGLITDVQAIIAGWMIKDQVPPQSIYYVPVQTVIGVLGVLEAVLWKWGYKYLAMVITSHAIVGVEEVTVGNISSREQIDPKLVERIKQYYPYVWSSSRRGVEQTLPHPVINSIDHVVDILTFHSFRATAAEERLKETFGDVRRKLPVFSDIKNLLAELIIDLETRLNQSKDSDQVAVI